MRSPLRLPLRPSLGPPRIFGVLMLGMLAAAALSAQTPHRIFVTSVTGTGDLSTWADADGESGLRAADAVCRARAAAATLPNDQNFVAWLSDSTDDAYCRAHGLSGKVENNCGRAALPEDAGPWVRTDGFPFGGPLPSLLRPAYATLAPVAFDEFGQPATRSYFAGTRSDGSAGPAQALCSEWTAASDDFVSLGDPERTGGGWNSTSGSSCRFERPLLCLQSGSGPPLEPFEQAGARAFVTSASGTGDLSTWDGADGNTGIAAADAVCRAEASRAGIENAARFEAWISDDTSSAVDRLENDGPWVRLDGVPVADDKADLIDGALFAPINLSPDGFYYNSAAAWTGTDRNGQPAAANCDDWSSPDASDDADAGRVNAANSFWTDWVAPAECSGTWFLYCLEDAPPPGPACRSDARTLCLGDGGRFAVSVAWQTSDDTGLGNAVDIDRRDSGLFTFFDPNNLELLIKVLDGCAFTDHFWVFYGATTDVAFQIEIEDVLTGTVREYSNPLGMNAESVKDFQAFPCGG